MKLFKTILLVLIVAIMSFSVVALVEPKELHEPRTELEDHTLREEIGTELEDHTLRDDPALREELALRDDPALREGHATNAPESGERPEPRHLGGERPESAPELALIREQVREKRQLNQGLETALEKVQNENARVRLQQNMERFQEQMQTRLERMKGLEVTELDEETGMIKMRAKEPVKFLGFIKGSATKRFEVDNKGQVTEKQPWYRFLYKDVE